MAPRPWKYPARSSPSWDLWEGAWPHQSSCSWGTRDARPEIPPPEPPPAPLGHPGPSGRLSTEWVGWGSTRFAPWGEHPLRGAEKTPEALRPLDAEDREVVGRARLQRAAGRSPRAREPPDPSPPSHPLSCSFLPTPAPGPITQRIPKDPRPSSGSPPAPAVEREQLCDLYCNTV